MPGQLRAVTRRCPGLAQVYNMVNGDQEKAGLAWGQVLQISEVETDEAQIS